MKLWMFLYTGKRLVSRLEQQETHFTPLHKLTPSGKGNSSSKYATSS